MYYKVNNARLYVNSKGNGDLSLIFLHFWGGSSRTWQQVTSLLENNFRCITIDFRGWGASDKTDNGYEIQSLANDVLTVVEQMQLDNYILVGHSMGGKVAQAIAARKPAGLKKMILVAPSPAFATILPVEMVETMENAYTTLDNINATIDHVFRASDISAPLRQIIIEDMQQHSTASRLAWPAGALAEDVSEGLEDIDIPVVIIAGEHDIVDPPERLQVEVADVIPGSRMIIMPAVGHLIMVQKPSEIAVLINEFCQTRK